MIQSRSAAAPFPSWLGMVDAPGTALKSQHKRKVQVVRFAHGRQALNASQTVDGDKIGQANLSIKLLLGHQVQMSLPLLRQSSNLCPLVWEFWHSRKIA